MNGKAVLLVVLGAFLSTISGPGESVYGETAMNSKILTTVDYVDVNRYMGKWYSIASIPQIFTKPCAGGMTADYSLRDDGTVDVHNACYKKDGSIYKADGRAWVVDKKTNAKLKVTFFLSSLKLNALAGDYWVIDLGPDYEYAVVGEPSRKYGWVLSRTRELPGEVLDGIVKRLEEKGYNWAEFEMINHKDYGK